MECTKQNTFGIYSKYQSLLDPLLVVTLIDPTASLSLHCTVVFPCASSHCVVYQILCLGIVYADSRAANMSGCRTFVIVCQLSSARFSAF